MKEWEMAFGALYIPSERRTRRKHLSARRRIQLGVVGQNDDFTGVLRQMHTSMHLRAIKRSESFLTQDEVWKLWKRAAGKCELTGITFSLERIPGATARPWSPSIDRLDCGIGYEFRNCRLVCTAVNVALNAWGEAVLLKIAQALYESRQWSPSGGIVNGH